MYKNFICVFTYAHIIYGYNMSIRDELLNKYLIILETKDLVELLPQRHIICKTFNKREIDDKTISIVMTTHNRPEQTLFTLKTIANSSYKNVHVVIVDDYKWILLYDMELEGFGIYIDYVRISDKFWINPCINYNIGFKFVKGNRIIIQNGEVCHIGDVISYVDKNLSDGKYLSFDVLNLADRGKNFILYTRKSTSYDDNFTMRHYKGHWPWYQHYETANNNLHFLTAITKKDLDKAGWFDHDFCLGMCWDDNAFIYKIKLAGINIVPVNNEIEKVMGIHQWHKQTEAGPSYSINNDILYENKSYYHQTNGVYIDLTEDNIPKHIVDRIKKLMD